MADYCDFLVEIIVTRLKANDFQITDADNIEVNASFAGFIIPITASRINVKDNENKPGYAFRLSESRLKGSISKCGMPVSVLANNEVLGSGVIHFPAEFIGQIQENMNEVTHVGSCEFERDGQVVGTLEVVCRLYSKCNDDTRATEGVCRQNMDKSINPRDIMFVMGENQSCANPCDPCNDIQCKDDADERLQLDFQRYRSTNAGAHRMTPTFLYNPVANAATCEITKMARECEEIVNSIVGRTGLPQPMQPPSRQKPTSAGGPVFSYENTVKVPKMDECNVKTIPVPINSEAQPNIKPIRFCPVCLTNMSWLPKFAACPNCGVKPMPVIEERHKKRLTAEQILLEYLGKPPLTVDEYCVDPCAKAAAEKAAADQSPRCRCTCESGTVCAHCRIRKLCTDIFQGDAPWNRSCPKVKPRSSEDFCVENSGSDKCRPHLARVFSELRDLYSIKADRLSAQHNKECGKRVLDKNKSKEVVEEFRDSENNKPTVEKIQKAAKQNPTDNYAKTITEPKRTPFKVGHKSCVKQKGAVSRRHGWAWSSSEETRKHGWKPGYVRKSIKKIMKFFLQYLPGRSAYDNCVEVEKEETEHQAPILQVRKEKGEIFITLRAVNDTNVAMKPIEFKIVKSDFAKALSDIKRRLKAKGYRKCTCHKPLMMCVCRNYHEKRQLGCALQKECKRRGMQSCVSQLVLTDTSESDMEYDFDVTPPAGMPQRRSPPKPRTVNHATQSSQEHTQVPPTYPINHGLYWRPYDCAARGRYTGTALGAPGEEVIVDGKIELKGKKQKQKSKDANKSNKIIPVRTIARLKDVAKRQEEAKAEEMAKNLKKAEINMMKYLKKHGGYFKSSHIVGPDGLTDAQRKRRALLQVCPPPIELVPRLGKGYACVYPCCNPCPTQCCNPYDCRWRI